MVLIWTEGEKLHFSQLFVRFLFVMHVQVNTFHLFFIHCKKKLQAFLIFPKCSFLCALTDWLDWQTAQSLYPSLCMRAHEIKNSLGTSVNSFYTGGFLHADDIRTLANSISTLEEQVALVQKFASDEVQRW